ncbi:metalloprotease TldD [Trichonephila clavata]|uniref:Metalloprotease TldD n=1 Tax=Trichonephila clavata TaxID=2740835 RepID=A0A8X6L0I5_TRICU|nr:metalloprotease TldD [Trichonephila clavata]
MDLNTRRGFGLRSFCEDSTSFVCSSEISEKEISNAASMVKSSVSLNKTNSINLNEETTSLYSRINPTNEMDLNSKIKLLNEVNELSDIRPLVRFNVLVIIEKDGRTERGSAGHGGRDSYSKFISEKKWKEVAKPSVRTSTENGKITQPVKGATLIGDGPTVLKKVSMVGNDLKLDPGVGTCSKDGQNVPVGVGQPTLKVDAITVGGTEI